MTIFNGLYGMLRPFVTASPDHAFPDTRPQKARDFRCAREHGGAALFHKSPSKNYSPTSKPLALLRSV
jgi:hypothetical protein